MLGLTTDRRWLVGVVHLPPLPGSPRWEGPRAALAEHVANDARALVEGGVDAVVVENFGDAPFFAGEVPPETVASLALCTRVVLDVAGDVPVGVNVLRNDARAALGICAAVGARFVRVNVHTGAAVTDQGLIEGRAAETLRERARLCPEVAILADVHVKHATPLGRESIEEAAADLVQRGLVDGVIVSGTGTGRAPVAEDVQRLRPHVGCAALLLGSGVTDDNAAQLVGPADGAIVGTWLKRDGRVDQPVDVERVRRLRRTFDALGGRGR